MTCRMTVRGTELPYRLKTRAEISHTFMGVGKGMCRIDNFTGSSAANTFKINSFSRAPLYPNHEPGHSPE